ncbi:MAG: hypothetical protein GY696_09360 [Gammaproteobacteria bacterium]|nr:hypothetical protein [Gammaproteobacteria bacterium]
MGVSVGVKGSGGQTKKDTRSVHDVQEWLRENNYEVEWTGQKFQPKPLDLYRQNLKEFASNTAILSTDVQLHTLEIVHNAAVTVASDANGTLGHRNSNLRMDALEANAAHQQGRHDSDVRQLRANVTSTVRQLRANVTNVTSAAVSKAQSLDVHGT